MAGIVVALWGCSNGVKIVLVIVTPILHPLCIAGQSWVETFGLPAAVLWCLFPTGDNLSQLIQIIILWNEFWLVSLHSTHGKINGFIN